MALNDEIEMQRTLVTLKATEQVKIETDKISANLNRIGAELDRIGKIIDEQIKSFQNPDENADRQADNNGE